MSTEPTAHTEFKRRALLCLLAVLALATAFALTGCKYSDVLTQHTEDPTAEVDENAEPTYEDSPDADLDLDLATVSIDESEDQNTQVAALPHYDPEAPDNGPTKQLILNVETPHDEEASQGKEEGDPDREGQGEGAEGGETTGEGDGNDNGNSEGDADPLEGEGEPEESTEGTTNGDTVQIDPDGTNDDTAKGTVAAVGEYATIAQMLGGAGALAACDQSWLDTRNADGCFKGELDRVKVAFTGDGTGAGSCNVDDLVSTIQPSVVLWDSMANVPALSEDERSALEEAGITVQPVPHIGEQNTEDYDVKLAVAEVASILEGASGLQYSPADVLTQYNEFHDQTLTTCYDANSGYSYKFSGATTFDQIYQDNAISGLFNSTTRRVITVYIDSLTSAGSTLSVSRHTTGKSVETSTYDASDGIGLSSKASNGYLVLDYYLQLAGVTNNSYDTAKPDSLGRSFIVMPGAATTNIGSSDAYGSRSLDTGSALAYWTGDDSSDSNWHQLGDSDFNTILVADTDIQNALVTSANKSKGLYHVGTPYNIVVVPSGIAGSWAAGHLDSFLMAPWAFRVQDAGNLDSADDYAESFYKKFLRCDSWDSVVANWNASTTAD